MKKILILNKEMGNYYLCSKDKDRFTFYEHDATDFESIEKANEKIDLLSNVFEGVDLAVTEVVFGFAIKWNNGKADRYLGENYKDDDGQHDSNLAALFETEAEAKLLIESNEWRNCTAVPNIWHL